MQLLYPPTVPHAHDAPTRDYRASWPRESTYLNDEHRDIWQSTKDLPGWQDTADSEKLYEMAFHSGSVILEIGMFGGRSATVELRGALRAAAERAGLPRPQYYGVDVDRGSMLRTRDTLAAQGLLDYTLLYHGDLARFHRDLPIVPTMVFVDGDHRYPGVWADLNLLRQFLAPGTPVLCHDYSGIEGVRNAIDEWLRSGFYESLGQFAGSVLLRTTNRCPGKPHGLTPATFDAVRTALLNRHFGDQGGGMGDWFTPSRRQTAPARAELRRTQGAPSQPREGWPYLDPTGAAPLPATLPNGHPWPKITVVTPSYNQGKYVEQTILSVLNQNYPNVEHIVMDGGSTDETLSVLDKYRDRLAKVVSEKDRGQSHAINKGMALATGDLLTWINSDDMLAPGALGAAAMAFHTSSADMIAGVCRLYRDGQYIGGHVTSCADGQPLPLQDLLDLDHCWNVGQFFHQPETMFTRDLWQKAGGRVEESLYYSMDYDLWLRFAQAGARLHVIGRPIAYFRVHEDQKTYSPDKFIKELTAARDNFAKQHNIPLTPPNPRTNAKHPLRVAFNGAVSPVARALATAGHHVTITAQQQQGGPTPDADWDGTELASRLFAVCTDQFRPTPQGAARGMLALPVDGFVVLAEAPVADQVRDALRRLELDGPVILPPDADAVRRNLLLSAADVFVGCSINGFAEAAACGTPAVGLTPGSVSDRITGRMTEGADPEALADTIGEFRDAGPAARRDMGAWARLYADNEWSLPAAAHRAHNALTASGLADRLPLSRKISFPPTPAPISEPAGRPAAATVAPAPAPVPAPHDEFTLLEGFGPWQPADPARKLPRCCWALGPASRVRVATARPGRRRLTIACHNYEAGQTMQVVVGGQVVAESKLPVTAGKPEHVLDVPVDVPAGPSVVELRYKKWAAPAANRPARAILVTRITCDPAK